MTSDLGWYLYAFLTCRVVPPMPGIDGRQPLCLLVDEDEDIGALTSPVPLAEFGEEVLRRNLEDSGWLEAKVRRHEAIIEAALAAGPVLPMKFGTIFLGPARIRGVLRRNARRLRGALEALGNKEEWGVKGVADSVTLRDSVIRTDPLLIALARDIASEPPGRAFLLAKKIQALALVKGREKQEALARQALAALQATGAALTAHPPLVAGQPGATEVALNVACLVERNQRDTFLAEVNRWNRDHAEEGLRLVSSGPWPVYHFVPQLDDDG